MDLIEKLIWEGIEEARCLKGEEADTNITYTVGPLTHYWAWTKKCIIALRQAGHIKESEEFSKYADDKDKQRLLDNCEQMIAILNAVNELNTLNNDDKLSMHETLNKKTKTPMVFISHSSKDKECACQLVNLLEFLKLGPENLFCSSVEGYGIKLGDDIFDTIRQLYIDHNLIMIYLVSRNYLNSPMSLNEMGAAWLMQYKHFLFILKDMQLEDIKNACVGKTEIAAIWNNSGIAQYLNDLRDYIVKTFNLAKPNDNVWERHRNDFIEFFKSSIDYSPYTCKSKTTYSMEEINELQAENEAIKDRLNALENHPAIQGDSKWGDLRDQYK